MPFPFHLLFPSNRSHLHIPKTETSCISTLPSRYVVFLLCSSSPLCGCSSSFLCLIFQVSLPVLFCPHHTLLNGKFLHILHTHAHTHTHPFSPPSHHSTKECPPLFTSRTPCLLSRLEHTALALAVWFQKRAPKFSTHHIGNFELRPLQTQKVSPPLLSIFPPSPFCLALLKLFLSLSPFHLFRSRFSFSGSFPQSHPPPANPPRACPVNSGRQSRTALSCSRGGTCVDKSKSRLTSDMCRMGWRHRDRGTGENRNVYTLTQADDVPWCRPSAGIISLCQNTCGNCAEPLLRMTFTQSEQYRGSAPGR